jgi:large subunit ribosomal protein L7/L12
MSKIENIIEELKSLTLLEASELVQKIEQVFNVDTSVGGGVMMMTGTSSEAAPVAEEKTEFDVILETVPADKKIQILKVVRAITGLGLKEAKELVDTAPKPLQTSVTKDTAENVKKELETAGATITIK